MKGRLIGRDGRNIRAIEKSTGVDLIVDESPDSVTVSCFDPIRRQVAINLLNDLIKDGRIHPARIESLTKKAQSEINKTIRKAGEDATFDSNVKGLPSEIIEIIGRLKYRYSYGENVLQHSVEVANFSALMAEEIGADVKVCRTGGFLHDIGKGKGGEHNKKGEEISKKIVLSLGENITVAKQTSKLVYHHSLLSDVAFKKDFEDHSVIRNVTQQIKKIPFLRSLFILTVTDISAVDQGLWNNWKATLLSKLFLKIEQQIKKPTKVTSLNNKISKIQQNIVKSSRKITKSRMSEISKISYPNYWLLQSEKMIAYQIETFLLNENINFDYVIRKFSNTSFFDIIIVTKDRPGLFLNLISIFVSEDLSIYESRIFTLDNGTVIDTFKLSFNQNRKYSKYDAKNSLKSLNQKIRDLGKGVEFKLKGEIKSKIKFLENKADVEIDNISSATYSILIVKTNNRPKLLYDISKILLKNKIVISMAKISTNGDFVEDSFHLRSEYGSKIQNKIMITNLKTEIQNKLNQNLINAI